MTDKFVNFINSILFAAVVALLSPSLAAAHSNGIVKVRSAYSMEETIARITKDVAGKGIKLFDVVDQAKLAKEAGITLNPSTLIIFGNPPLGTQFLVASPEAGLDWPVRLLVYQDSTGQVWTAYTDFQWIARRHKIRNRGPQFKMASEVVASITSAVKKR
ncbi:MAG TPA: DUF302 domain-containing protein [Candidatus Binatia bacterium]|nr:DUF302 domain-containing protein [Candidatus Binatia bacterium]